MEETFDKLNFFIYHINIFVFLPSAGKPFCGVEFVSLRTGDGVQSVPFKTSPVHNIEANRK